jgi:hypothetical protein
MEISRATGKAPCPRLRGAEAQGGGSVWRRGLVRAHGSQGSTCAQALVRPRPVLRRLCGLDLCSGACAASTCAQALVRPVTLTPHAVWLVRALQGLWPLHSSWLSAMTHSGGVCHDLHISTPHRCAALTLNTDPTTSCHAAHVTTSPCLSPRAKLWLQPSDRPALQAYRGPGRCIGFSGTSGRPSASRSRASTRPSHAPTHPVPVPVPVPVHVPGRSESPPPAPAPSTAAAAAPHGPPARVCGHGSACRRRIDEPSMEIETRSFQEGLGSRQRLPPPY